MSLLLVTAWLTITSLISFVMMYLDKRAARRGGWRTSEFSLLFWAFLGGGIGAKLAQKRFRHKTRKEPFRTVLNVALLANAVTVVILLVPELRQWVFQLLSLIFQRMAEG